MSLTRIYFYIFINIPLFKLAPIMNKKASKYFKTMI